MSETKLQIKYEGEKINLSDLAQSIKSLDKQYLLYTKESENNLYVKKVSEGSLAFDICENIRQTMPIFASSLQEYTFFLFHIINSLLGLKNQNPNNRDQYGRSPSIKDYKDTKNIFSVAENKGFVSINFNLFAKQKNYNIFCDREQSRKVINGCLKKINDSKSLKSTDIFKNVELVFLRASNPFLSNDKTNNKGIVIKITKKPKQIIFKDEIIEKRILGGNRNILNHKYIVDIEILTKKSLPSEIDLDIGETATAYKILHLHDIIENLPFLWKRD